MRSKSNIAYHPTALNAREEEEPSGRITRETGPIPMRSANPVDERLHEEFETLRRWIDLAASVLERDPILRQRHAGELKSLNQVSSTIGQLNRVIIASDKKDAIDRIEIHELKARLQRRSIEPLFESKH